MTAPGIAMADIYDPLHPDQLADPYPVYQLARAREPIFRSERVVTDTPVWVLTRYDDIVEVESDQERFISRDTLRPVVPIHPASIELLRQGYPLEPIYVATDGPAHRRTSVPLKQVFSARTALLQEKYITEVTDRLLDDMTAGGARHADLIARFAARLPLQVVTHLLGIPDSDQDRIKTWCEDRLRFNSAHLSVEEQARAVSGMQELFHYLAELVARRRARPRPDDLVTLFIHHQEPGFGPLRDSELVNNLASILVAGHISVTNLIGNGTYLLLSERRHWDAIVARPGAIPRTVEEILRFRTPTKSFFRTAARDTALSTVAIREGDLLQLLFGSANHDESRWQAPEVFDPTVDRSGTRLMSFGHGPHYCVGAPLARAQSRIAFERLTRRLPGLRLAVQDYRYLEMVVNHGFQQLTVEW